MAKKINFTEDMLKYCENDKELLYLKTRLASNSNTEAAKKLCIDRHTIGRVLNRIYARVQAGVIPANSHDGSIASNDVYIDSVAGLIL